MSSKTNLILICGPRGGGKSHLAAHIRQAAIDAGMACRNLSLADPLYGCLGEILGHAEVRRARKENDKERPLPELGGRTLRHALQTLGTNWGRDAVWDGIWLDLMGRRLDVLDGSMVEFATIDDVRFRNEYDHLVRRGNVLVVRTQRAGVDIPYPDHESEAEWPFFPVHLKVEWDDSWDEGRVREVAGMIVSEFRDLVSHSTEPSPPGWTWEGPRGRVPDPVRIRRRGVETEADRWDAYVDRALAVRPGVVPGDEWGAPESWKDRFGSLLAQPGFPASMPLNGVEIGQGSGKYTRMVLDAWPEARILCCDVSDKFLDQARVQLASYGDRVGFHLLSSLDDLDGAISEWEDRWGRGLDLAWSIDAMVHADQPVVAGYLKILADHMLDGGRVAMTLASLDSETGADRLLTEEVENYSRNPDWTGRMTYWSRTGVESLLRRIGFSVEFKGSPDRPRDLEFVAEWHGDPVAMAIRSGGGRRPHGSPDQA